MWRFGLLLLTTLLSINLYLSAPVEQGENVIRQETDPELTAGYFEGDMILPESRNGLRNQSLRWPNKVVYYNIHKGFFDEDHINHIHKGLKNLEAISCLRFEEVGTDAPYFVNVTGLPEGCYSTVGFRNRIQQVNLQIYPLDSGCFRIATIMHEFLHTLGFYHTQSTHNRDDYVKIIEENIIPSTLHNFDIYNDTVVEDYGIEYDYASVMHYSAYAFSANGEITIQALKDTPDAELMGQRRVVRQSDIDKLNLMYRCPIHN